LFLGSRCCRTVVPRLALLPHRCSWAALTMSDRRYARPRTSSPSFP
jgi:hypothetical protein